MPKDKIRSLMRWVFVRPTPARTDLGAGVLFLALGFGDLLASSNASSSIRLIAASVLLAVGCGGIGVGVWKLRAQHTNR